MLSFLTCRWRNQDDIQKDRTQNNSWGWFMMNAFPPFGVLCASPMLCHLERQHYFFLLKKKGIMLRKISISSWIIIILTKSSWGQQNEGCFCILHEVKKDVDALKLTRWYIIHIQVARDDNKITGIIGWVLSMCRVPLWKLSKTIHSTMLGNRHC